MAHHDDGEQPRRGVASAFALLTSWLFNKRSSGPAHDETEFLNTRDGYELKKFARRAFGGEAEAQQARAAAVEAEQAEIDALLQGTGAVPIPHAVPAEPVAPAPMHAADPAAASKKPIDLAVKYLEQLRAQGLSVETLAEALIIIESRDVRRRAKGGG